VKNSEAIDPSLWFDVSKATEATWSSSLVVREERFWASIPDHAKFLASLAFENFFAGIALDHDPIVLAVDHFFALSPSSTRRRIADERVAPFAVAQASTWSINGCGMREVTCGSRPVAGRPRRLFFGVTFIDFFMNF
jgi:hypothetical protein